jgi:hypothetical protein
MAHREIFFLPSKREKEKENKNFCGHGLTNSAGWKRDLVNRMAG